MILIFNKDGTAKKVLLNEYIQQGSDKVNSLICYINGYVYDDLTYSLEITLPDGTQLPYTAIPTNFELEGIFYQGAKFILDATATSQVGTLTFNLVVSYDNKQLVSYEFSNIVNKGVVDWDSVITNAEYNNLLAQLHNFTEFVEISPNLIHIVEPSKSETYIDRPYLITDSLGNISVYRNDTDITKKFEIGTIFALRTDDINKYDFYIKDTDYLTLLPKQRFYLAQTNSADFDLTQTELNDLKANALTLILKGTERRLFIKNETTILTMIPRHQEIIEGVAKWISAYNLIYQWNTTDLKWEKVVQEINQETIYEVIQNYIDSRQGEPNGLASLDANGKVPTSQIPDGIDEIISIIDLETRTELPESVSNNQCVAIQNQVAEMSPTTYFYKLYKGESGEWVEKETLTNTMLINYNNVLYRALVDNNSYTTDSSLSNITKKVDEEFRCIVETTNSMVVDSVVCPVITLTNFETLYSGFVNGKKSQIILNDNAYSIVDVKADTLFVEIQGNTFAYEKGETSIEINHISEPILYSFNHTETDTTFAVKQDSGTKALYTEWNVKEFVSENTETNTTEIGNNVEIDGNLIINTNTETTGNLKVDSDTEIKGVLTANAKSIEITGTSGTISDDDGNLLVANNLVSLTLDGNNYIYSGKDTLKAYYTNDNGVIRVALTTPFNWIYSDSPFVKTQQGAENEGKIMMVGSDGNLSPQSSSVSPLYQHNISCSVPLSYFSSNINIKFSFYSYSASEISTTMGLYNAIMGQYATTKSKSIYILYTIPYILASSNFIIPLSCYFAYSNLGNPYFNIGYLVIPKSDTYTTPVLKYDGISINDTEFTNIVDIVKKL